MNTLLETYLYQVGRKLAPSTKDDILKELRANIQDEWEQKTENEPLSEVASQAALEDLLIGLGSPDQVAASYTQSQSSLVSQELLEVYWMIVKFALMGISIAFTVIGAIELATSALSVQDIIRAIASTLARIWSAGLSAFGMITLIFILVTKSQDQEAISNFASETKRATWDKKALYSLSPQPLSKDIVKSSDAIASIIGVIFGFLVLNGITYGSQGNLWMAWISDMGLQTNRFTLVNLDLLKMFMPYINIAMASSFLLHTWLLIKGKWQLNLRVLHMVLEVVGLGIFFALWFNPSFFDWAAAEAIVGLKVVEALTTSFTITSVIVALVVSGATIATLFGHIKSIVNKS